MDVKDILNKLEFLSKGITDTETLRHVNELQRAVFSLSQENRDLREELHDLKNDRDKISLLEYSPENKAFYYPGKENELYCSKCYHADKKAVRMDIITNVLNSKASAVCPVCKHRVTTDFDNPKYDPNYMY